MVINTEGSFIDNGITINGAGSAKAQKNLATDRWWYISSPMSNATASAFPGLSSSFETGTRLFYWDEVTTHNYVNVTVGTDALPQLRGYSVKSFPLKSPGLPVNFIGSLNTGTVGSADNLTRTGTGSFAGYNLVGNPYPSAIDWGSENDTTLGLTKMNLEPTIW
ncbi:MAG: hypothetical protein HGB12_15775, partial [Bacteroidetes bacterium]|nr:hypothetical protein [Bacteroidota bacterium]